MAQRDATSAPITRDMIARIYLDDDVPSQSVYTTNYYNTTGSSATITSSFIYGFGVYFVVNNSASFSVGELVSITGITGGLYYNSANVVITSISSNVITTLYPNINPPSGTPTSYSGAKMSSTQGSLTQTSNPQTTWDDRVNGTTPFTLYRQFPVPKWIRWDNSQAISNMEWSMYDDQGRSLKELWNQYVGGIFSADINSQTTAGQVVSFVVNSTTGMQVGQIIEVAGISGSQTGYNNQAQILSITSATQVKVVYPAYVALAGMPTFSLAPTISNTTDFTSSFAWNLSVLCSED